MIATLDSFRDTLESQGDLGVTDPVSGEVVAVNAALEAAPGTVNEDPLGKGWFVRMRLADPAELDGLMGEDDYKAYVAGL